MREGSEEIRGKETSVIAVRDGIRAQNSELSPRKKKIGLLSGQAEVTPLNRPNFFSQQKSTQKICGNFKK